MTRNLPLCPFEIEDLASSRLFRIFFFTTWFFYNRSHIFSQAMLHMFARVCNLRTDGSKWMYEVFPPMKQNSYLPTYLPLWSCGSWQSKMAQKLGPSSGAFCSSSQPNLLVLPKQSRYGILHTDPTIHPCTRGVPSPPRKIGRLNPGHVMDALDGSR